MSVQKKFLAVAVVLFAGAAVFAHDHEHGEGDQLGQVHFATSCAAPAQKEFDHAVALLHSFQFSRAIEGFKAVLAADPSCAIAYWGISLSNWGNPFAPGSKSPAQLQMGRDNAERGMGLGAKTGREAGYLHAVSSLYEDSASTPQRARVNAYRDAMEGLAAKYPDDEEAQIYYALSLVIAASPEDKTYASQIKAGAILEKLFAQEPMHPGLAHYIIHAYDVPALADRAVAAARRYAQIAPDAPHALHMPSHTFTRLGYWQESIDTNAAAAVAARREGQVAEELHASDYETYALLQTGQDKAAGAIVHSLPEITQRFDANALLAGAAPTAAGYFALAAIPARYALERQDWPQAQTLTLRESPFAYADAMTWFARGLGAARSGHPAEAAEAATALVRLQEHLVQAKESYWARQVEIQATAISAWAAFAAGRREEGLRQMASAAALEDGTEKSAVTPGPLFPAHELLGEMNLQMNQPAQAQKEFETTLTKEPRRFRALLGAARSAQLAGDRDSSRAYFRKLVEVCARSDDPGRPELAEARRSLEQMN